MLISVPDEPAGKDGFHPKTKHPLIDIDGTAFLQVGIFMVLALVATKFLFKPYLAMRDQRDAGIEGARKEAAAMSSDADAQLADYEAKLAAARSRANDERRKIRTEAADKQREVTDAARNTAASAMAEAQAKVSSQTETARAELAPQADKLAAEMVEKLLGRKVA